MMSLPLTPIEISFKGQKETLDNQFGSSSLHIHRGVTTSSERKKKGLITGLFTTHY